MFLTPSDNERQVIVSKKLLNDVSSGVKTVKRAACSSGESFIKKAASLLNQIVVVGHTSNAEPLPWPPTVESLQKPLEEMPSLLTKFFELLIQSCHNRDSISTCRIICTGRSSHSNTQLLELVYIALLV